MRFIYYVLLICICTSKFAFSQISVDTSIPLSNLIENNFIQGCVEISDLQTSVNGNSFGLPSYGYFNRENSNFPFQEGIVLSTGNAASGGNATNTTILSEDDSSWGTDPDLETALGISNTVNATSIEFDIISISNQIQFNYLLASEEYYQVNPCDFSDGFAFLIKETGSAAPYQNIALIPGTNTPVNTNTIHNNLFPACPAANDQYFAGYNIGDTNYNGRTTVLTAATSITPYVQYHIKLVIADQTDGTFDSAVFIEGNSFKILDLGDDIATCAGSTILNAEIQNPLATYEWFLDDISIVGETSSSLNAIQSGTYRVEVTVPLNSTNCVEEDEIVVVLNTEETINPITDYQLCDDSSGDGLEVFDLSSKNAELVNTIPFTNYDYSYHLSDAEARSNTNSINAPIQNTLGNPQPIYVRVQDLDTGCYAYSTFNLIVNSKPNILPPTDLEICDGDGTPDGNTIIDLTQANDEITANQSNLVVSYHYNATDANTGNTPIPSTYINLNTPTDLVHVRVVDSQTGCFNTTTLTINMSTSPIINRDTQYIDACDLGHDGTANFDLTQALPNILNGLTGVSPSFHTTNEDAESGANPIPPVNESNYQNINLDVQVLYVRIEDDITGCYSITPLEIHTNLLLTATELGDFALCDVNDDDSDSLNFDLITIEGYIANDLPNISVTFYQTESDRDDSINAINKSLPYPAVSPETLYIRIDNGNCSEVAEIRLIINPILLFQPLAPLSYCDIDNDGTVDVELSYFDDEITGGNTDFTVTYFANQTDAENNFNPLPPFHPVTMQETIYARIENIDTGCNTVNNFDIQISLAPSTTEPSDVIICDNDQDGFSIINLNSKISEIVTSTSGLQIDFFTSFEDADTNTNAIPDSDRDAFNTNTQTIYIRVEDAVSATRCYAIESFEAIINTNPVFTSISNFQICENDGDSTADFLLVDKDTEILNGQTGKEVYYFEDDAFTMPIDKYNLYQNTTSPQTIYVRVENITDSSCFNTTSFLIQVSPDPIYTPPTPYLICDDISNDGVDVFDLNEKITEISQGSNDNLNISFHLSQLDAEDNIAPQPLQYTNIENPQILYVRIESDNSFCYVVEELGINIIEAPSLTEALPFEVCDDNYDGLTSFNLENADFAILDRLQTNLITNYFETFEDINQNDGLNNSNEITNPSNYISNSSTIYIKVANTATGCFTVIPLELIVNLPPVFNPINTIPICENDTNTFDLSIADDIIVNNPDAVNISYHNSSSDAINDQGALGNTYNYIANSHTIFVRLEDANTGCPITTSFNLQINPNPIANTAPDLVGCDDDFDGFLQFDLNAQSNAILGLNQSPLFYTVTYFDDLSNAMANFNPLNQFHAAFNADTIYARVENNITGCYDVSQFNVIVNPLPIIPINDIVPLCTNDVPLIISANTGVAGETYLWSTGETTSEIQLQLEDIGEYWVTVTTPNNCEFTKPFSVIESESASINFTTTVDFADPNSITVNVSGIGDYAYILDDGVPQASNVFNNVTFGVHLVTIRDLNGCQDVSTEVVVIDIPKFVTPNNDGYFDTWHIVGIEELPGTVIYIYNRYGKLLKTLSDNPAGWDGTYNGQNMPSDDYWFVAKVIQNGEAFDVKGHFALKR